MSEANVLQNGPFEEKNEDERVISEEYRICGDWNWIQFV
jgi:hypothetical protein